MSAYKHPLGTVAELDEQDIQEFDSDSVALHLHDGPRDERDGFAAFSAEITIECVRDGVAVHLHCAVPMSFGRTLASSTSPPRTTDSKNHPSNCL